MASPIPPLGLGTFGRTGEAGIAAMLKAIAIGYRHIDTAQTYNTEVPVGEAVRRSGLPREEFFITTKVADFNLEKAAFAASVEKSLDAIGLGPVDLLLVHWPSANDAVPLEHTLDALAEAQRKGHTRLIGVSNFTIPLLDRTVRHLGESAIATNQVEIHPYLQAPKLAAHARSLGLTLTAYQPLAKGQVGTDPVLREIAGRHGVTASAVALTFLMAEGHLVIPASSSEQHLRDNFAAGNLSLAEGEIEEIRRLDRGHRLINPAKSPRWDD